MQGTKAVALALDALVPEGPLLPADPERRAAVEAAESWGDEVLQPVPRRLTWASLKRDHSTIASYLEGSRTGMPMPVASRAALPIIPLAAHLNKATDDNVRRDLEALPALIEHVDELIAEGTLGGAERNVADYQIATSVSLLLTMAERWDDLLALYDRALARVTEPSRRLELLDEAAHVAKDFAGQGDRAIQYLELLFPLKPADTRIATSLERPCSTSASKNPGRSFSRSRPAAWTSPYSRTFWSDSSPRQAISAAICELRTRLAARGDEQVVRVPQEERLMTASDWRAYPTSPIESGR